MFSPTKEVFSNKIVCRLKSKGVIINELDYQCSAAFLLTEHLLVISGALFKEHRCHELDATTSEIKFEFSCKSNSYHIIDGKRIEIIGEKIIECGIQMLAEEEGLWIDPNRQVWFLNCLLLDEEARRAIIQRWAYRYVCLPGREVSAEFTHRATGNSITISKGTFSASSRFKACIVLSPNLEQPAFFDYCMVCCLRSKGVLINELYFWGPYDVQPRPQLLTEHMFVFYGALFKEDRCVEVETTTSDIQFEFSCSEKADKIIECGVQILADEVESSSSKRKEQSDGAVKVSKDKSVVKSGKHTGWWGWLKKLGLEKKK